MRKRVRRRHEHHVRQVIVDFEIVIVEGPVLLGIEHLEQRRRRVAAPIGAELVDLVEQKQRVRRLRLFHALQNLARHRPDIGAPVAANLGLVPHPAQRHAHKVAAGGAGDRFAERGLADARGADQAQDRTLHLFDALLDGEVFEDPLLDLFQPEMIGVEHLLGALDVALDLGPVVPRHRQQPVEVVAHDRRLGRHRAHAAQLFQLRHRLVARFLGEGGLVDPLLELGHLVAAVLAFAELLLDRLHLLVEVVFALRLLHLPLDAVADALFDLQDADLAFHVAEHLFEALAHRLGFEQLLLFGDLQGQVRGDRVGELGRVVDLIDRDQHLGRDLFVELDVLLELRDHGARQRRHLLPLARLLRDAVGIGLEKGLVVGKAR